MAKKTITKAKLEHYDDSNIKTLSGLEHIRHRPGMYIGRLGDGSEPGDGIYILLKEVIDNSIDEFKMNAGNSIEINVEDNLRISVRDYGRGIPSVTKFVPSNFTLCGIRLRLCSHNLPTSFSPSATAQGIPAVFLPE